MLIRIDNSATEPLFAQLAVAIRRAAAKGEIQAGERLPSGRDLAASLGLNVHTVLRAYQELRAEGLIELRRGRGAVVTAQAADGLAGVREALARLCTEARRTGLTVDELVDMMRTEYQ